MVIASILFGFVLISQATSKVILPPIPRLYGYSNCPATCKANSCQEESGKKIQTFVSTSLETNDCVSAYNCEKQSFPTASQAPFGVIGVQTRTLITPYAGYQECNNYQNTALPILGNTKIGPQMYPTQILPVTPQCLPNPSVIEIVEPLSIPNQQILETIVTPLAANTCDQVEIISVTPNDCVTPEITSALQQLINEIVDSKLDCYTDNSAITVLQEAVIQPEVIVEVPAVINEVTECESSCNYFSTDQYYVPLSEGQIVSRILIPSEIPVNLLCDITEIQALQPKYQYEPVSFSFC